MDEEKTCKKFCSIQGQESKANYNNPIFGRVKVEQNTGKYVKLACKS